MDGFVQIGNTFAQEYRKTPTKLKVQPQICAAALGSFDQHLPGLWLAGQQSGFVQARYKATLSYQVFDSCSTSLAAYNMSQLS